LHSQAKNSPIFNALLQKYANPYGTNIAMLGKLQRTWFMVQEVAKPKTGWVHQLMVKRRRARSSHMQRKTTKG
jgi:hypothetical protein